MMNNPTNLARPSEETKKTSESLDDEYCGNGNVQSKIRFFENCGAARQFATKKTELTITEDNSARFDILAEAT